ncbi:MAG: type IV pilus assembly protein PilM [Candidatus Omnitrophica bacterium]|nr:type IV pilus assembly protein PilM [Candidatus Omnitrophota bacterium]
MKRTVGIDIGTYSAKLVELENRKGRPTLTKCAMVRIANGDRKIALESLLSQAKLTLKRVNVSLSGPSVIVRYIEMPQMRKDELDSAIRFEAEKYLPFNISESTVDCAVLDNTSSGNQRVLLVAAKRGEVDSLLGFFKEFGLEVGAIDADCFAFFNSFDSANPGNRKEEQAFALVNIGARFSNMNIVAKGALYFTRDLFWGGADISKRIKDAMGLGMDEAEKVKQDPAEKREEVVNVIAPALEKLTQQIRMSFDYFETQVGRSIEKIYISGGTSYLFNIVDFLKENLHVDVMMWNPFEGIAIDGIFKEIARHPAMFTVAVGLALRK